MLIHQFRMCAKERVKGAVFDSGVVDIRAQQPTKFTCCL